MDNTTLLDLSREYGTPLYVYDLDAFGKRMRQVRTAFGEHVELCYSMKANPFLLKNLPPEFTRLEVCSPGELAVCESVGADMSSVIFSGVNKTLENVRAAVRDGVGLFTAESRQHLDFLEICAAEVGKALPVLLRLTSDNQFGIDEPELRQIVRDRSSWPNLNLVGLHYFSGTLKKRVSLIERELTHLEELLTELEADTGLRMEHLEYGAGLWIDYFGDDPDGAELALLRDAADVIRSAGEKRHLCVEMGRFYSATCGTYLTTVQDLKENCGYSYAIADGGIHQMNYDGQVKGMLIPHLTLLNPGPEGPEKEWTLCGSLCTPNDVMVRRVSLSGMQRGSILAFHRTGAYSVCEGIAMLLSRDLPAVVLYDAANGARLARDHIALDPWNTPLN